MMPANLFTKRLAFLLGSAAVLNMIKNDSSLLPMLQNGRQRHLSLDLGGGKCEWTPAAIPEDGIEFHKTVIAGYPCGDKRMVFTQMEALTGWNAIDSWDFNPKSTEPFIKTNHPHRDGTWGWDDVADQVVLVLRNIRTSLIEYHAIAWDFDYSQLTSNNTGVYENKLYESQPPMEQFYTWRDERVMDEIDWYGWFIDYWMEGGLMRDVFTHKITTPEHWDKLLIASTLPIHSRESLSYDLVVGPDTVVTPSYERHCELTGEFTSGASSFVTSGCEPVAVISGEKLMDYVEGPNETAAIANALLKDDRMGEYVIPSETWNCIWNEIIVNKKGPKNTYARPGSEWKSDEIDYKEYNFSAEMLTKMILELTRVIEKYSGAEWNTKATAIRLVQLLEEHRDVIQTELDEVNSSTARTLKASDFLGPKERIRQRVMKLQEMTGTGPDDNLDMQADFDKHFRSLEKKMLMDHRHNKKTKA